jgi:hypothetical protein
VKVRAAVLAVAAAGAMLVPARSRAAGDKQIETPPSGITALLRDYSRAWLTHDQALLGRTLAPGAMRGRQMTSLHNAAEVPFRVYDVAAETHYSGNLASLRVRNLYPHKEVAAYEVTIRTAFDIEDKPSVGDGAFTFIRDEANGSDAYDGWRLVSDSDMDVLAFFTSSYLWDDGPVTILRSPHFLVLAHPDVAKSLGDVTSVSEEALARALRFWPQPVRAKYAMIIPTTTDELSGIVHDTADIADFVAFVASGIDETVGWEPGAPRIYVHLDHFRKYNRVGQVGILAHEFNHAITRPVTGPHISTWIDEGMANVSGGLPAYNAKGGTLPTAFPTDDEFVTGSLDDIVRNYDQAQVAIQVLINAKGRPALARFYEKLGSERIVPGTDKYYLSQIVRQTLGWTLDQWVAEWRKALR